MNTRVLGLLGVVFVLILAGCGKTDSEVANLNKAAQDLKQQVGDLKRAYGELSGTVDHLKDSQKAAEAEYSSLKQVGENLRNSLEQKDSEYVKIITSLEQLRNAQTRLDKVVTHLVAETPKITLESQAAGTGISQRPKTSDRESRSAYEDTKGKMTPRVTAEVCEAIDQYVGRLNKVMRSSSGATQERQMNNALAELETTMNKFRDQRDTAKIVDLAENLKWYAYNASRSRSYIAGEPGWRNLLREDKNKLMSICSQQ
ncbi:MAG TPA: hypothetical protein VMC85_14695 [Desulfomonilaceae bacterium]|nr:hypothetical protein [Desulfomonilaceae bacterium]